MVSKKEIISVAFTILIITFSLNLFVDLFDNPQDFLSIFLIVSIVILCNLFAKKVVAYFLDSEIETSIWEFGRLPFVKDKTRRKHLPMGALLPLFSKIILFPFRYFIWMGSLVFEVKPRVYRSAKRFGLYTFSDITEYHLGIIAAAGIVVNLALSVLGYLLGYTALARISLYYAFFNILPLGELDGNKIFYGNILLWSVLSSLVLIGLLFAIFTV